MTLYEFVISKLNMIISLYVWKNSLQTLYCLFLNCNLMHNVQPSLNFEKFICFRCHLSNTFVN